MNGAASRRHVFETNTNRFALIPQLHGTKPFDNLCQEASIGQRYASGVDPVDDLGDRLDPSAAARKAASQETVETHLGGPLLTPPYHTGHQGIFPQKGPTRHDRLRAEGAVRPLPWWPEGGGVLGQFRVGMLGVLQRLFHP